VQRTRYEELVRSGLKRARSVCILGPRQCGKTTLARIVAGADLPAANFFDLENPLALQRLENPVLAMEPLRGTVVLDEIQRRPELFPVLRYLIDQGVDRNFLILGSASGDLLRQSSESLAGRITYIDLTPFQLFETGSETRDRLWLRGGFPPSYLAEADSGATIWLDDYIRNFVERDLPAYGVEIDPTRIRRFWMMLAHYHGQVFNASELGRALDVSHHTIRRYLNLLEETFMVRTLTPWFLNIGKRVVKSPKVYIRDSGLLHQLLGIQTRDQLLNHPKIGASWEGFALESVANAIGARPIDCFFWAVHGQAEIDLLVERPGKRTGYEFKYTDTPKPTRSMYTAMQDLDLDRIEVVYPGNIRFAMDERIEAVPLTDFAR